MERAPRCALGGRVVLITGASGGLGVAVTNGFLAAGARVAATARSWRDQRTADRLQYLEADLSVSGAADALVARVVESAGRIDALVHLVGGWAGGETVASTTDEAWEAMLAVNLHTAFRTIRAALPAMMEARRGRILAVGSRAGEAAPANSAAYNVSKAALHALVRSVAAEVRALGITANAVLPSTIDTPANRAAMPKADPAQWVPPSRIASTLVWLASDAASGVNGALIPMYGGS